MFDPQPLTPIIIKVVPPPTPEVSVVDILVGSFGLIGLIVIASIVFGLLVGALLISYSRWRINRNIPASGDTQRLDLSSPLR